MRIYGSNGTAALATTPPTRRATAGGFSVTEDDAAPAAGSPPPLRTVGGIDALIALQGIEDPTERRRHAVKRGRLALDALDELKIGLLGGDLTPGTLQKLKAVAAHLKNGSGHAELDGVLAEIELRVEVEIAKMAAP
jgi:Class II flagellar assembly regulator